MAMMDFPATIEEQVEDMQGQELGYPQIHNYCTIDNLVSEETLLVPYSSLINKYRHFLTPYVGNFEVPADLRRAFRYAPKALSYYIYRTTEMWSVLLDLNNCKSTMDFDKEVYKVYDPYNITSMINEILILEGVIK